MEDIESMKMTMAALSMLSIVIISIGILVSMAYIKQALLRYTGLYFLIMLSLEIISRNPSDMNVHLLSVSSYVHFGFLYFFYSKYIFNLKPKIVSAIIAMGSAPMLFNLFQGAEVESFQSYDRAIYSFSIMLLALSCIYYVIDKNKKLEHYLLLFNIVVLLYFSLETLLSVATNYLINENLSLVNSLWMLRAFLLQLFYISIIYTTWRIGRTH